MVVAQDQPQLLDICLREGEAEREVGREWVGIDRQTESDSGILFI